jgi:hypothetical protein
MPAIIHPGAVIHYWDHLVITLRDGAAGIETGFLSLYAISYSPSLGAGHVAILETQGGPGGPGLAITISDDLALGERQQARLVAMGDGRAALRRPPLIAGFERIPFGPDGFGFRLSSAEHEIEARWESIDPPFWVDGQGGAFHDAEDIWALMVGARRASLVIDGVPVPGVPFDDDVWRPKLGRSLSSAHGAFAEVRVEPVRRGRATGSDPAEPR